MLLFVITGCTRKDADATNNGTPEEQGTGVTDDGTTDEMDTGSSETWTFYHGDYRIYISGPESGCPSADCLLSTYYVDEENEFDVSIELYAMEGTLEDKKQELEKEFQEVLKGKLWGNDVAYYIADDEYHIGAEETVMVDKLVFMLPLGDDSYLQIDIKGEGEPLWDGEDLLENSDFQEAFTLEIGKRE